MEEKQEIKKQHSGNGTGVRVVAGILAFLMVASLLATAVTYLINL